MEDWKSDWIDGNADSKFIGPELPASYVFDNIIADDPKPIDFFTSENVTNSPNFSMDSNENLDDESHIKTEHPLLKTSIINATLAKKRLQAYSKQVRKSPVKEEKVDNKFQKETAKKTKKDLYPDEKAKAVIQEIEEIKRKDQEVENIKKKEFEDLCRRLAVSDAIRCQFPNPADRIQQFRRRGIKQRNYRRTDSFSRKSPSPEDVRTKDRHSPVHKDPKDWTEFKKQNLSIPKDGRGRPFARKGFSLNSLEKLYTWDGPPPSVMPCRIEMENGIREVPLHSIKVTKSRPSIIYSVNTEKIKESFPTRHQLYGFVSKERQQCINDVINKHAKVMPESKKNTSQPWYNKQWRKSFTECKVLENSVGLSFLQNYSDEEDDIETEEIIICSTAKKNTVEPPVLSNFEYEPVRTFTRRPSEEFLIKEEEYEKQGSISKTFSDSKSESPKFTPERNRLESVTVANSALEDESGNLTPDISALPLPQTQKSTQKLVKQKKESEQINKEPKLDPKHKKKKKRKLDNEQSDDDTPKKKKKKKSKSGRVSSSENSNSYNGNKKKKKQKKTKTKEKRIKKKKTKADASEIKLKKKDRHIKKKRKQVTRKLKQSPLEDVKKKPKKKIKKQEETSIKKSNKKEATPEKTPKQKRIVLEASDSDSEHSIGEKIKEDKIRKKEQVKRKKIKKESFVDKSTEKHVPMIDIVIKKEPEDETFLEAATNNIAKTPITNNYSGNWEKDDLLWEIEEENIPKEKLIKLNSSCWESDEEELYEKRLPESRPIEKFVETKEVRDLEMPLNIKPFKKREIQIVKLDNLMIEQEKQECPKRKIQTVKLDNLMIEQEKQECSKRKIQTVKLDNLMIEEEKQECPRKNIQIGKLHNLMIEQEKQECPKRKIQTVKLDNLMIEEKKQECPKKNIQIGKLHNLMIEEEKLECPKREIETVKLDNLMIEQEKQECPKRKIQTVKLDNLMIEEEKQECPKKEMQIGKLHNLMIEEGKQECPKRKIQIVNLDNIMIEEDKQECPVVEKIEMNVTKELEKRRRWDKKEAEPKTEQILFDNSRINKPEKTYTILENEYEEFLKAVSSNANSSLLGENSDTKIVSISSSDPKNNLNNMTKEESKIIIAPNDIPFIPMPDELKLQPVPSPCTIDTQMKLSLLPKVTASSTLDTDGKTDNVTTSEVTDITKSFTFTTLMLPSKKVLIDNSNLKLGDSDDEKRTVMKPIEDVKQEVAETKQTLPVTELPKEKNLKIEKTIDNAMLDQSKTKLYSVTQSDRKSVDESPSRDSSLRRDSQPFKNRRESPRRKPYSPSREYSPRRRRKSPERYRSRSPTSRKYHSRRHYSPPRRRTPSPRRRTPSPRRRTPSPRRRSPRRSVSPRNQLNTRISSRAGDKKEKVISEFKNVLSSPLEGPKRSVADSTISDDSLLPQPNLEEYAQSPVSYYMGHMKLDEGKRLSLDERINRELGFQKNDFKPITTTYDNFCQNRFSDNSQIESYSMDKNCFNENISSNYVQLGNMVEIVPTDLNIKTDSHVESVQKKNKPRILQVGNVLHIVPTELPPDPPPLPSKPPAAPPPDKIVTNSFVTPDKKSVEVSMKDKIEESKDEREKRKIERETKRKEKENRRREKEKRRQIKMKQKTENMIKKALQLEVENQNEEGDANLPAQWPPIHISSSSKDLICKRSILLKYGRSSKSRKKVQFADGIRPGDGTSPSAGEDLTSPPPPSKVLPKEKRYTKTKLGAKHVKKKVKVKIIKPNEALLDESEEDDNLPPPSPPPGSPPPHIFPPRIKPQIVTNHGYVPNVVNQSPSVYRSSVNMLMMQPPLPDSPMQIHSYQQYQVPPLVPSTSMPSVGTESTAVTVHRSHFNYSL